MDGKINFKDSERQLSDKEYYLGLDMGTNSIGYAVTDTNYKLIYKGGKALWGVHLFEEAETAETRRLFRTGRRRRKREKMRIKLLQEIFNEAISEKDPGFFKRMQDSFFWQDDKEIDQPNTLFNDENYKDKDYHAEYPTIYHLRKELCESKDEHDVRLVYLALHHILKNRGHFLTDQLELDSGNDGLLLSFQDFINDLEELCEIQLFDYYEMENALSVLCDKNLNRSDTNRSLQEISYDKSAQAKEYLKLLSSMNVSLKNLFPEYLDRDIDEEFSKIKFSFNDPYGDENPDLEATLETYLTADEKDLLDSAYRLTEEIILHKLLQKNEHERYNLLSEARMAVYDQHAEDLKKLKSIFNELPNRFPEHKVEINKIKKEIFRENKKNLDNYLAYSGHVPENLKQSALNSCTQEEFLKYLNKAVLNLGEKIFGKTKDIKEIMEAEQAEGKIAQGNITNADVERAIKFKVLGDEEVLQAMENGNFMPRIRSKSNGVIPYQLNLHEMKLILDNAEYLDFLTEEVKERLISIMSFRIPYYVGPFDDRSEFAWIERKKGHENETIRPWNFDEVVDQSASASNFIRRMTAKCSYLFGEDVLAKNSLLYSEFMVRNSLNNLRFDNERLDPQLLNRLYDDLFVKGGRNKVTDKRILKQINDYGIKSEENLLEGIDQEIPHKLKSYKDFKSYISEEKLSEAEVEKIIDLLTVFPDSPELIFNKLKAEFSEKLSEDEMRKISKLKYKDWGRLSEKFLNGIKTELPTGRKISIIELMREEGLNLMEILHDERFNFAEIIEKENEGMLDEPGEVSDEYLEQLRLSPPVKKAVRKTLKLCREIFNIMGGAPAKIFVEMARENQVVKKRTVSRKNKVKDLYKALKEDCAIWDDELNSLPEERFNSKAIYLYSLQQGRCMYTGKKIDIEELKNNKKNKYDIDHIHPRSLTKDDSMDNLVLVCQESNREKGNRYPVDSAIQGRMLSFWHYLNRQGFLSDEKFSRLTRKVDLTREELKNFINRQLVETRQSSKAIAQILEKVVEDTKVVYVKANLVSDFRYQDGTRFDAKTKFYFPKVREINDYHHAKDAYLNVVVGNFYNSVFTESFYLHDFERTKAYNLVKVYDRDYPGIWISGENGTIKTVKNFMSKNNVLLSYEVKRQTGGFYDQMLVKKGKGQRPIKTSVEALADLDRYGGYNSVKGSHFCLIKYKEGKKEFLHFILLPRFLEKDNFSEEAIKNYLATEGFRDYEIIEKELKYGDIIKVDGLKYRILGKSNNVIKCAIPYQGHYSAEMEKTIKDLARLLDKDTKNIKTNISLSEIYESLVNKLGSEPFINYSSLKTQWTKLNSAESRELFNKNQNIEEKIKVIFAIIQLLTGKSVAVDLSRVYDAEGGKKGANSGLITISSKHTLPCEIKRIDTSITGFFVNERRLN